MTQRDYSLSITKACAFIQENLEKELRLDLVAQASNLSKFHFQRLFTLYTGISPFSYIKLLRLKKASYQLALQKEISIIDIAFEAGFESQEAFTRAFKKTFSITPKKFREHPNWKTWSEKYQFNSPTQEEKVKVEVIDFNETRIAYLKHTGSHHLLNETVAKFIQWRKETGLSPINQCKTFGIAYCDPHTTEPENFEFDVCSETLKEISKNDFGVKIKKIPQGKCARVQHLGAHEQMDQKIYSLYRDWLPESGERLRDFPLFFHYHNVMPLVAESELITDIYLPLE